MSSSEPRLGVYHIERPFMRDPTSEEPTDAPSHMGKFGWHRINSNKSKLAIPVIIRTDGVRYCPTRILNKEVIDRYDQIPQEVFDCVKIGTRHLTASEAELLNQININHCNHYYGDELFMMKNQIMRVADIEKLIRFLNVATQIQTTHKPNTKRSGVIKLVINPQHPHAARTIPYLNKRVGDRIIKFIPAYIVSAFVDTKTPPQIRSYMDQWDIMYCRMVLHYAGGPDTIEMKKKSMLIPLIGARYIRSQKALMFYELDQD